MSITDTFILIFPFSLPLNKVKQGIPYDTECPSIEHIRYPSTNVKSYIFKSFSFMCSLKYEKQLSQRVIMY